MGVKTVRGLTAGEGQQRPRSKLQAFDDWPPSHRLMSEGKIMRKQITFAGLAIGFGLITAGQVLAGDYIEFVFQTPGNPSDPRTVNPGYGRERG